MLIAARFAKDLLGKPGQDSLSLSVYVVSNSCGEKRAPGQNRSQRRVTDEPS